MTSVMSQRTEAVSVPDNITLMLGSSIIIYQFTKKKVGGEQEGESVCAHTLNPSTDVHL